MGQTLADRVLIAKSSDGEMNDLLREYRPFILSAVLTNSPKAEEDYVPVSYTHLTLPTICSV